MKLQIDTEKKTILIEESIKTKELYDQLMRIFPSGEWEEYTIEPKIVEVATNNLPWINPWQYGSPRPILTNPLNDPTFPFGSVLGGVTCDGIGNKPASDRLL